MWERVGGRTWEDFDFPGQLGWSASRSLSFLVCKLCNGTNTGKGQMGQPGMYRAQTQSSSFVSSFCTNMLKKKKTQNIEEVFLQIYSFPFKSSY